MANIPLNDPDFDQSVSVSPASRQDNPTNKSFFDSLDSKNALIVGLVGGVMTLCTIGFIILLSIYLKGGIKIAL